MRSTLMVALGGSLGAAARYLVSSWVQSGLGKSASVGTTIVNLGGSFLIGLIMTYGVEISPVTAGARLFLVTGILGGLTTLSTFNYETIRLFQEGNLWAALSHVALNVGCGLLAVMLGMAAAKAGA